VGRGWCVGAEDGFAGANSGRGRRERSIAKWKRVVLCWILKADSERVEGPKLGSARECCELHEKLWKKKRRNPSRSHTQTLLLRLLRKTHTNSTPINKLNYSLMLL